MHHDDNFRGVKREIRFIFFSYAYKVYVHWRHEWLYPSFLYGLLLIFLSHSDVIRQKRKIKREKTSDSMLYKGHCDTAIVLSHSFLPTMERGNQQHNIIRWSTRFHEQIFTTHLHISFYSRFDLLWVVIPIIRNPSIRDYRLKDSTKKKVFLIKYFFISIEIHFKKSIYVCYRIPICILFLQNKKIQRRRVDTHKKNSSTYISITTLKCNYYRHFFSFSKKNPVPSFLLYILPYLVIFLPT
jgi:hypothetical protein